MANALKLVREKYSRSLFSSDSWHDARQIITCIFRFAFECAGFATTYISAYFWWCLPRVSVYVTHSRKAIQKVETEREIEWDRKRQAFPSDNKQESFIVVLHIECRRLDTGRRHFADVMSLVYVNMYSIAHTCTLTQLIPFCGYFCREE